MASAATIQPDLLRRTYSNVQALRAVAALLVVIGHVRLGMGFDPVIVRAPLWYSGVDVFFVISGFIISVVAVRAGLEQQRGERIGAAYRFWARRAVRIYPIYWAVLAVCVAASPWFPLKPDWMDYHSMWGYVLLTVKENAYVPQAWSMAFEVFFYAVLGLILLATPRRVFQAVAVWMAAQLVLYVYATASDMPDPRIVTDAQVFEFGFGSLVAYLVLRGRRSHAALALVLGLAFFAAGTIWTDAHKTLLTSGPRTITFGIGSAFMVYAAVAFELRGMIAPRFMQRLGDASYSLYLWHDLLLVLLVAASAGLMDVVPRQLLFFAWLGVVIVAALASYRWLERPMIRALNRLLRVDGRRQAAGRSLLPTPVAKGRPLGP